MANPRYHTWQDAKEFLDERVYRRPDVARLQTLAAAVEREFEGEVRGRIAIPIDESESPDTFEQATLACAMRTAAQYALEQNQAEGNDAMAWFPKDLRERAQVLVDALASPHKGPEDRVSAEAPLAYLPTDGLTATTRPAAIFTRDNITSGNSKHW